MSATDVFSKESQVMQSESGELKSKAKVLTSGAVLRGPVQRPVRSRLVQVEREELLVES